MTGRESEAFKRERSTPRKEGDLESWGERGGESEASFTFIYLFYFLFFVNSSCYPNFEMVDRT